MINKQLWLVAQPRICNQTCELVTNHTVWLVSEVEYWIGFMRVVLQIYMDNNQLLLTDSVSSAVEHVLVTLNNKNYYAVV